MKSADNKFKIGEVVFAKVDTQQKLTIADYKDRIYYCKIEGQPDKTQLVYFERELIDKVKEQVPLKKETTP